MNDKTIINIISKMYSTIVAFFIFIFLLLSTLFIVLHNGIFIDKIDLVNLHVKELYIKWNEKIDISIEEIQITDNNAVQKSHSFDYKKISNYLYALSKTDRWFSSIIVDRIIYNDLHASFRYKENENSFFSLQKEHLHVNASIFVHQHLLQLKILELKESQKDISLDGNIYFDMLKNRLYSDINLQIADELDLKLYTLSDDKMTYYNVKSNRDIKEFKKTIALANLSDTIMFWAYRAIDMSTITIKHIKGFIAYDDIANAYKNIDIETDVNNLNYTYNTKLDEIHTKYTELNFKNGNLIINPKEAYSYGMYLGDSHLVIDFKQKDILLTLNLLFQAKLNHDVLKILNAYKIDLPFYQNSGSVDTDLTLKIALRTIDIDAQGIFRTKKSNFKYLGLDIDIESAAIYLDNFNVDIKNMAAKYKDIAKSYVDVKYNTKKREGSLKFRVREIHLKQISDAVDKKPLLITYNINPKGDSIDLPESLWRYNDSLVRVDAVKLPFDLKTQLLNIPATYLSIDQIGDAFVTGSVDLKTMYAKLNVDVLTFSYDGITLRQTNTPLKVIIMDDITIKADNDIFFSVSGSKYVAKSFFVKIEKEKLSLRHTTIQIGDYITTKIYAQYNFQNSRTHVSLSNFILIDPNTKEVLYKKNKILLNINLLEDKIKVTSKEIRGEFISQDSGWKLKINDLGTVAKRSALLSSLHIDNGSFLLYKNKDSKYTRFKADLEYPYKILVKNNTPISHYKIRGKIYKNRVTLILNNNISVNIKEKATVEVKNSVVNLNELFRFLKETPNDTNSSDSFDIILTATDSNLFINKKRKILYDKIEMQLYNGVLSAQMDYKDGHAGVKYKNKEFNVYGKNFNDTFMNNLFSISKFSKGYLDFSFSGNANEYNGILYVNKTIIKDYKTLNNILAFINTIPSLVTFSLPGYNRNGLFVKRGYINFKAKNNIFDVHDINLESKEINIAGKGNIDLNKDYLDIALNLKTDLGSDIAKVPVVGYLLLNEGTLSTTLKMKGSIDNPKITSLIAEDIAVAPFNIIKRTLSLPYKIITGKEPTIKGK